MKWTGQEVGEALEKRAVFKRYPSSGLEDRGGVFVCPYCGGTLWSCGPYSGPVSSHAGRCLDHLLANPSCLEELLMDEPELLRKERRRAEEVLRAWTRRAPAQALELCLLLQRYEIDWLIHQLGGKTARLVEVPIDRA